jgi:hypothetical protein
LLLAILLFSCQNKITTDKADAIYFGGHILTMEDANPTVEATGCFCSGFLITLGYIGVSN